MRNETTMKTKRITVIAAFAVIAAAAIALTNCASGGSGRQPSENVVIKAAFDKLDPVFQKNLKPNAAIAVFIASADTLDNSEIIYEQLQINIVNSGRYNIVEKRHVDQLLEEHDFQRSGLVSDDTLISFGKLLGADAVILSSVTGKGGDRKLVLIAVDMANRATLAMVKVKF